VPDETFAQAKRKAAELGISRSEFFTPRRPPLPRRTRFALAHPRGQRGAAGGGRRRLRGRRGPGRTLAAGRWRRLVIRRGSICWADLGEAHGSRPAKRRPVLIIQADPFNASRLTTTLAATSSGLPKDSVVNVTALVTLDKSDLDAETGPSSASPHERGRPGTPPHPGAPTGGPHCSKTGRRADDEGRADRVTWSLWTTSGRRPGGCRPVTAGRPAFSLSNSRHGA